jgi:hypothetical protein
VTPELSMQVLVWTETAVEGGKHVSVALPAPAGREGYMKEVCVVAFPTPGGEAAAARVANWRTKANFPAAPRGTATAPAVQVANATAETAGIDPASVVDLTGKVNGQGQLEWDAPAGGWTVIRFGQTTTGAQNRPGPENGTGLEIDKFSKAAMDFHFGHVYGPLEEALKPLAAKGRAGMLIDSYETGLQNWTAGYEGEFKKRAGYDLHAWLPAMTGRVVGSLAQTERFLWDVRKTQADLMAENYYGRFAELCHQHGLQCYIEPYDPGNFDETVVGQYADMPMG